MILPTNLNITLVKDPQQIVFAPKADQFQPFFTMPIATASSNVALARVVLTSNNFTI